MAFGDLRPEIEAWLDGKPDHDLENAGEECAQAMDASVSLLPATSRTAFLLLFFWYRKAMLESWISSEEGAAAIKAAFLALYVGHRAAQREVLPPSARLGGNA